MNRRSESNRSARKYIWFTGGIAGWLTMPLFIKVLSYCIVLVLAQTLMVSQVFAESYTYDAAGRLTSVTYDNGSSITYTYDKAGNIILKQTEDGNASPVAFALVSPPNGANGLGTSITFVWKLATDPNGDSLTYQFFLCEDSGFTVGCISSVVASTEKTIDYAVAEGLLPLVLFGSILGTVGFRRRKWLVMAIAGLMVIGLVSGCGKGGGGSGTSAPTDEKSHKVSGLKTGTIYYWKVSVSDGIDTVESATRSFTTL